MYGNVPARPQWWLAMAIVDVLAVLVNLWIGIVRINLPMTTVSDKVVVALTFSLVGGACIHFVYLLTNRLRW